MKVKDLVGKLAIRVRPIQFDEYPDPSFMKDPIEVLKVTDTQIAYVNKKGRLMIAGSCPELFDDNWESWDDWICRRRTKLVNTSDIKIPSAFSHTIPQIHKLTKCLTYYRKFGKLDRDIIVNKYGILIDGYVGYLVAKMFGIDKIEVVQE